MPVDRKCRFAGDSSDFSKGTYECGMINKCKTCDFHSHCSERVLSVDICDSNKRSNCPYYPNGCERFDDEVWQEYNPTSYFSNMNSDDFAGTMDNIYRSFDD